MNRNSAFVVARALSVLGFVTLTALPGCQVIGGIFKAGAWTGVILTVVLLMLVGGGIAAFRRS